MKTNDFYATRRDVLRYAGAASAATLVGMPAAYAAAQQKRLFEPDLALELTAAPHDVALRPGPQTPAWSYQARVLKGDPASVQNWNGAWLGPILHLRRGQKVRIDFINKIGQPSIVNWHGLHVPADMMGLPRYEVAPGKRYRYEFEVRDRAGTYWYHAMAAGHSPEQVYFGLAGLLYVSDKEEQALPLPRDEYDLPVVIQDRSFGDGNRLFYLPGTGPGAAAEGNSGAQTPTPRGGMMGGGMMGSQGMMGQGMMGGGMASGGMGSMMTRMMGFFGDTICVNGQPAARLEVATHAYRLRVLNASNARTYKVAWQDGRPLTMIATDGGLLDAPLQKDYVMLTPGQRVELWADFSEDAVGTEHRLISRAFQGSMGMMGSGMGGGAQGALDELMSRMMSGSSLPDGAEFPILEVAVTRKEAGARELPRHLSTVAQLRAEDAVNRKRPRQFHVTMGHMQWGFNGRSMQMNEVASDEIVTLGTTEIWEFKNNMMMAHAIHLHGLQFQVLGWSGGTSGGDVAAGRIQPGWQDTVLLMPNERVRLIMRFKDFAGTYAYQCHMLEHAASGLMRDYRVRAA